MNYLAHLFLTQQDEQLTLGNFLADMLRKSEIEALPDEVQEGVMVHKKIDAYTDAHPLSREVADLLRPRHGKYAPVVVDLLYDYILGSHWQTFSDAGTAEFCEHIYAMLSKNFPNVPTRLQPRVRSMVSHRWLHGSFTAEGFRYTLQRMDERARFPSKFVEAMDDYDRHQDQMDTAFCKFFVEIMAEAGKWHTRIALPFKVQGDR